jgi:hypothetical protein
LWIGLNFGIELVWREEWRKEREERAIVEEEK